MLPEVPGFEYRADRGVTPLPAGDCWVGKAPSFAGHRERSFPRGPRRATLGAPATPVGGRVAHLSTFNRIALAVALLGLGTARAELVRIARPIRPGGEALKLEVPAGASRLVQAAGAAPECRDKNGPIPCVLDVKSFGGPVISNVKVYAVLWDATVDAGVAQGIGDFYRVFTSSEFFDWLTEYSSTGTVEGGSRAGQPGPGQIIGRGTFGGTFRLSSLSTSYPGCPSPDFGLTCLTDAKIAAELQWQVAHGVLPPPDANTLYVVHLPSSIRINDSKAGLGTSCKDYCAYHSAARSGDRTVAYAVIPDLGSNGCENGCGKGTLFQNTCAAASHEIAEAVTDVAVGLATGFSPDFPLGWYDDSSPSQGEIGDMCNQRYDTLGADGFVGCTAGAADCFTLQQSFSRVVWNADPAGHPDTPACVAVRYADSGDFAVTFKPNTLKIAAGETSAPIPVLTAVTSAPPGGAALPIVLSASDVPPGLHARFDSTSISAGQPANLTVSADPDAVLQTDAVLVVRATGAQTHSASILVQLIAPPNDWSLALSPATGSLTPGASVTYTVSGQVTSGKAEPVTLASTVGGLPRGVTARFDRTSLSPGTSTVTLTLTASSVATPVGASSFTISGTSAGQPGGHTASAQVQIEAPPKPQSGGCTSAGAEGLVPSSVLLLAGLARRRRSERPVREGDA